MVNKASLGKQIRYLDSALKGLERENDTLWILVKESESLIKKLLLSPDWHPTPVHRQKAHEMRVKLREFIDLQATASETQGVDQ